MKKYIIPLLAAALAFTACNQADRFDYNQEIVLITGTDSNPVSEDRVLADQVPITYNFSLSATGVASEDMKVHIQYDSLAMEAYNKANQTSYVAVPRDVVLLNDECVTIAKGTATSSVTSVTMTDNTFIQEGVIYVIPLSVAYVEGGKASILKGSDCFFIRVGKTMESFSLDIPGTGIYSTFNLGAGNY
nr:DUF1735 domain-containing protein [Bacteroidales bacterium]